MILYYVTDFYICIGYCSPEHPSLRARGRSMLGGDRRSFREYPDDVGPSRFIHTIQLIFLPSAFYKLMRHAHLYMFLCLLISKNLWLPSITFIACWDLKRLLPLSFSLHLLHGTGLDLTNFLRFFDNEDEGIYVFCTKTCNIAWNKSKYAIKKHLIIYNKNLQAFVHCSVSLQYLCYSSCISNYVCNILCFHEVTLIKFHSRVSYINKENYSQCILNLCTYRSEGTSTSEHRRNRRRSISITPEIGDDIVRLIFSNF